MEIFVPLYVDRAVNMEASGKSPNQPLFDAELGGRQCILYRDEAARIAGGESRLRAQYRDGCLSRQGDLYIYMDAMCFGMGMNCVQATFSCKTLSDARYLYDQLIVIAPLLLSVSPAPPRRHARPSAPNLNDCVWFIARPSIVASCACSLQRQHRSFAAA